MDSRRWVSGFVHGLGVALFDRIDVLLHERGATPTPILRIPDQFCSHRIQGNIFNGLLEVTVVSDETVPILAMPHPGPANRPIGVFFPGLANRLIGIRSLPIITNPSCREFLPRCHNLRHSPAVDRLKQDMHMVRHHHPGQQPIALTVKVAKRILHHGGHGRFTQNARAMPGIYPRIYSHAAFDILFLQG